MPQQRNPLGQVATMVQEIGLYVTYAYDDLVFVTHNPFLLRFPERSGSVELWFNEQCPDENASEIAKKLTVAGERAGVAVERRSTYTLTQDEDATISVAFAD